MAKRARTESFDPVYPYGETQGPIKDGSLLITPPSSPTPAPPTDIINPVYPFGQPDNVLEDGKVVITGDATALIKAGPGLGFQDGKLTVTPEIGSLVPVSAPITNADNTISLATGAGMQLSDGKLTLNTNSPVAITDSQAVGLAFSAPLTLAEQSLSVATTPPLRTDNASLSLNTGSGFTITDGALQYQLSNELAIANNALSIRKYCFAWTGVDSTSTFTYNGAKVKIYLSLERIGEHVYGIFSAYCNSTIQLTDKFSINFYFNSDGTLNSWSTYSGALGPRTAENTVGTPLPSQALLIPSPSYTKTPKVSLSIVGLNTENLINSNTFTTATVLVLYNWNVPAGCSGGITFRFIMNANSTATKFIGDLISFSYLGSY